MAQRSQKRTRGKGEGTIYQRPDGKWVGIVEAGRSSDGRRRRASIVRRTRQEIVDDLPALKARTSGGLPNTRQTLDAYLRYWLVEVKARDLSDRSVAAYSDAIERIARTAPHLAAMRLERITKGHVQNLVNELSRTHAPRTRQLTVAMLRQALEWAVPDYIPRNPADHVRGPRQRTVTIDDALTAEEARSVLTAAQGDRYEALWLMALKYGLRSGELLGLRWADVDFGRDQLTVRKSKTAAGERTVPLLADAKVVLAAHRSRGKVAAIDGWVFVAPRGGQLNPREAARYWTLLLERAGIAHRCRTCGTDKPCSSSVRRFHAARHTAATLLLEAGVPLEVVSKILGHASISITADIYAKVRSDLMRKGLETLG